LALALKERRLRKLRLTFRSVCLFSKLKLSRS